MQTTSPFFSSHVDISDRDYSRSPLLVFYEVTQACDLVCQHCRACAQSAPDPTELTPEESLRLIDQLAEFPHPPLLVLTGGDPLKRADIYDMISHGVEAGLDVSITPSATPLVTPEAIGRLKEAGILRLAVSIDGADAASHDAVRGVPGSFERSLQILADAQALGIPTQVNTTLTPANLGQIEQMATLLASQGISLWSVFFLVPVGRAMQQRRLNAVECESAFARLWKQAKIQSYSIKTTEAPHYRRFVLQQRERQHAGEPRSTRSMPLGINDGRGVMFVSHRGAICPSGFLPIVCGHFPLHHPVDVYQRAPVMLALRDRSRMEGKCRDCEFRRVCGGSRARAYAVTGNLFAPDPDCSYIPSKRSHVGGLDHECHPHVDAVESRA
jgi:radical SAM protein